jgi:hypothetical protein
MKKRELIRQNLIKTMFAKNNTMKDLEKNANIEEIKENEKIISTSECN